MVGADRTYAIAEFVTSALLLQSVLYYVVWYEITVMYDTPSISKRI